MANSTFFFFNSQRQSMVISTFINSISKKYNVALRIVEAERRHKAVSANLKELRVQERRLRAELAKLRNAHETIVEGGEIPKIALENAVPYDVRAGHDPEESESKLIEKPLGARVMDVMRERRGTSLTAPQIAKFVGWANVGAIRTSLFRLYSAGHILRPSKGRYVLPAQEETPDAEQRGS